jgi:hypothetical protein
MPSAVLGRAQTPLRLYRGRPFAVQGVYASPNGTPIDLSDFTLVGTVAWLGGSQALQPGALGSDGSWSATLDEGLTPNVPDGVGASLDITLTDALGNTTDLIFRISAETP